MSYFRNELVIFEFVVWSFEDDELWNAFEGDKNREIQTEDDRSRYFQFGREID